MRSGDRPLVRSPRTHERPPRHDRVSGHRPAFRMLSFAQEATPRQPSRSTPPPPRRLRRSRRSSDPTRNGADDCPAREAYWVTRRKGTEAPYSGRNSARGHFEGTFVCVGCGADLFSSDTKFESGTGWPSFYQPIQPEAIERSWDYSSFERSRRGHLRALRFTPGPCLQRRSSSHRPAILHQLRRPEAQAPLACSSTPKAKVADPKPSATKAAPPSASTAPEPTQ